MKQQRSRFSAFAKRSAQWTGRSSAFALAVFVILVWAVTGPIFRYSDTWQLAINTGTTIVTFLMVFLIQNTQNRDTEAIHIKLDELIRVSRGHNSLIDLENLEAEELEEIRAVYEKLAEKARRQATKRKSNANARHAGSAPP